ncbi:MAG: GNAT family N-acetyltransferase, partial [Planctomycetota bacterium]
RRSFRSCLVDFQKWSEGRSIVHHATDAASLAEGKRVLQELHRERWHADEKEGAFSSPRFCAFHDTMMQHLLDVDRLDLRWLTLEGRPLAAYYAFRYGDKLYYYQAGRVVDVPTKVRLGIVILVDGLKDAMARGLREFDFLAGQAQYKSLFTDTSRTIVELRVAKPTLRETVRKTLTTGVRMFRQVRARLQTKVQVPKDVNQTERPV